MTLVLRTVIRKWMGTVVIKRAECSWLSELRAETGPAPVSRLIRSEMVAPGWTKVAGSGEFFRMETGERETYTGWERVDQPGQKDSSTLGPDSLTGCCS